MIKDIGEFQKKVLGVDKKTVGELTASEFRFLSVALVEELEEWKTAVQSGNIVDQVDALLDLAYFAVGGIFKLGLDHKKIEACFDHIHATNMSKVIGNKEGREGFSSTKDAILTSSTHKDLSALMKEIIEEKDDKTN